MALDKSTIGARIREAIELEGAGDKALAIKRLRELNDEIPDQPSVKTYLGSFLTSEGSFDEAIKHAAASVKLAGHSELASLTLFHALWAAGYEDQAIDEANRFQKLKHSDDYEEILAAWNSAKSRNRGKGNSRA